MFFALAFSNELFVLVAYAICLLAPYNDVLSGHISQEIENSQPSVISDVAGQPIVIWDPCLPKGRQEKYIRFTESVLSEVEYLFVGMGDYQECLLKVNKLLNMSECSSNRPRSPFATKPVLNLGYMPSHENVISQDVHGTDLPRSLAKAESVSCSINAVSVPLLNNGAVIYGFSEYWYTTDDVLGIGGSYNHNLFVEKATVSLFDWFCITESFV